MVVATSQILSGSSGPCNWFWGLEIRWVNQHRPPQDSLQWGSFLQYPDQNKMSGPPPCHEGKHDQKGQTSDCHHFEVEAEDISSRIICRSFFDMSVSFWMQCLMNFCFSFRGISITSLSGVFRIMLGSILDPVIYQMTSGCQGEGVP